jgi:hypothetical protein
MYSVGNKGLRDSELLLSLSEDKRIGVTFVVSGYNRREFVVKCLNSIFSCCPPPLQVIYVDAESTDGTLRAISGYKGLEVHEGNRLGPASNWNLGASRARHNILVFLDSDAEISLGWGEMIRRKFRDQPSLGVLGCKILSIDDRRTIQNAGQSLLPGFIPFDRRKVEGWPDSEDYVFSVIGTAFAVRTSVFRKLGGFDEDFHYGVEDTDFCWRTWLSGYRVLYIPTVVYHKGLAYDEGVDSGGLVSRRSRRCFMVRSSVRNSLVTFLKDGESKTIFFHFLPNSLRFLAWGARARHPEGSFLGLIDFLRDHRNTLKKRRLVQSKRKISDSEMMDTLGVKSFSQKRTSPVA